MAFTPPAPGSIASRPTIKKGGVRGADESPEDFSQRMATRQASNATASPAAMPTRRDNILTARADGSFDAKRNAFNAGNAQHGRSMDEAGNITGSTTPASAPRPSSQLVPGRSAGSMVMPPAAPAAAAPIASPAPQAPVSPAAPAPAPPPGGIRPPAQTAAPAPAPAAPMGPPSTATASAGKMSLTPRPAPAPASRMAQRQQRTQPPTAAPPPPSPAVPPGTGPMRPPATPATGQTNALMGRLNQSMAPPPTPQGAGPAKSSPAPAPAASRPAVPPAGIPTPPVNNSQPPASAQPSTQAPAAPAASIAPPVAQPPARKVGMINDGQGWKPASEVNASLRAAQEARAAQAANPPEPKVAAPATMPSSGLNQAAMDAHWTPERREASRKEEKRLRDEYQAKEDAAAEAVRNKPKLKTDAEYREQHRKRIESNEARKKEAMSTVGTPSSDLDVESVNEQRQHFEKMQKLNPNQKLSFNGNPSPKGFSSFDEAATSMYGSTLWGKHVGRNFSPPKPSGYVVGR